MREDCVYSRGLQCSHNRVSLEEMGVDFGILVDLHLLQIISTKVYHLVKKHTILKVLSSSLIC
jgi:hypothetical protein